MPCYHFCNVPTDRKRAAHSCAIRAAHSRAIRVLVCCAYAAAGFGVVWAAESTAQLLFDKVRAGVVENVKRFPRYTCVQTIVRSQFELPDAGSSCATAIAAHERDTSTAILRWHDRLRLDVAVGEKSEMFSWAGASQFESGDITQMVAKGASGSGEFGSFLASVFGGDAEGFLYRGLQDTPLGRVAAYDFRVPVAKSHYQYISSGKSYATVGYHGTFLADPDTADLRELDLYATEFPVADDVCRVEDKIQYARTQIGQNTFMLPKKSSMDVIYRHATESLNEASFSGCREYVGESSIRFDVDENGNTPDAEKRAELRPLAPKTHLRVRIDPPIDSDRAAAGDPIIGVIETAVKVKNEVVVHPGDKLKGRVVRLEQTLGASPRWTVAILFETIERNGFEQKVLLKPVDDGDRSPSGPMPAGRRGFTPPTPSASSITSERPAGGGIFSFAEPGNLVLDRKFESEWETR